MYTIALSRFPCWCMPCKQSLWLWRSACFALSLPETAEPTSADSPGLKMSLRPHKLLLVSGLPALVQTIPTLQYSLQCPGFRSFSLFRWAPGSTNCNMGWGTSCKHWNLWSDIILPAAGTSSVQRMFSGTSGNRATSIVFARCMTPDLTALQSFLSSCMR